MTAVQMNEMNITLTINRKGVLDKVAETTEYTGSKMGGDAEVYDRIRTVDENENELLRFFGECRAEVAQELKRLLIWEGMADDSSDPLPDQQPDPNEYKLELQVSSAFSNALMPGMILGLFDYFVLSIVGKWYIYTNKSEASAYIDRGKLMLDGVRQKAYYKGAPIRPTHS